MYNNNNDPNMNAFWTIYLIFGLGCILFFFFGVCALLCCCRTRFRGVERKGYVIREAGSNQPLIQPGVPVGNQSVVITGTFPAQPGFSPQVMQHNPPQAPPPYEMPAKY